MTQLKIRQFKAFSLIELTVTVAVLGILSSMAIVQFQEYRERANDQIALSQLVQARTSFEALMADSVSEVFNFSFAYGSGLSTLDLLTSYKQSLETGDVEWRDQPLPGFNHDPKVHLRVCGNSSIFMILTSHSEGTYRNVTVRRGGEDRNDPRFLQHIFYSAPLGGYSVPGTGVPYSYYELAGGSRPPAVPLCPIMAPPIPVP